jgi:hypothetical protein
VRHAQSTTGVQMLKPFPGRCRSGAALPLRSLKILTAGVLGRLRGEPCGSITVEIVEYEPDGPGRHTGRNTMTFAFDADAVSDLNWHEFVGDIRAHEAELGLRAAQGHRTPCTLRRAGSNFALQITSFYWELPARSERRMTEALLRQILLSVR